MIPEEKDREGWPGFNMQEIPPHGAIADIFFPRLVACLQRERFEGLVRVSLGSTTKILYFKAGEIASAASNAEPDRLAAVLIQDGRLTEPQLEMAKARMPQDGSLGRTLIELGFLTPSELLQGARRQVRQILATCSVLKIGGYQVEPGPLPPEVTVLGLPTRRLIFDCILESPDRGSVLREIGSMESVFSPTAELAEGLASLKLDIDYDQVARMIDGSSTLRDLSGRTSLDDFTVSKLVLALESLGLAELVGVPAPQGAPTSWTSIPIDADQEPPEPDPVLRGAGATSGPMASGAEVEEETPAPPPAPAPSPVTMPAGGASRARPPLEPPPIPEEELPAFAIVQEDDVEWEIDPRTGERVHHGPIGVTFEGKVASPSRMGVGLRPILAVAGALTVAIAAAVFFLGRRGAGSSPPAPVKPPEVAGAAEPEPPRRIEPESARRAEPAAGTPQTDQPPATFPSGPSDAPPSPAALSPAASASPVPSVAPPTARRPAETAVPVPTPIDLVPMPQTGPQIPPHGSVSPFRDASRYMGALRHLDTGDTEGAARIFQELASSEPGRYTLQLMIACEEETLRTTRAQSGERGSLFFLSFQFKGRTCYRVCWGSYAGKDEARDAIPSLSAPLLPAGSSPLIVPIDRLRTP
jgi:uncharacterized protein DUF4388